VITEDVETDSHDVESFRKMLS